VTPPADADPACVGCGAKHELQVATITVKMDYPGFPAEDGLLRVYACPRCAREFRGNLAEMRKTFGSAAS
jgi:hypothetical protein